MKGRVTNTGYKRNSPDVRNDFNIIPSNRITMKGVDFPVFGVDNLGNSQMMYPGGEYEFQGDYVTELPAYGSGGLTQWFAEKWVDIKTGKKCGRSGKDKKGRPYPACRPSKRVNKTTPKTASELSAAEKAKFKRKKKSGKRIDYNHKRAQEGTEVPLNRSEVFNIPRTLRYENGNMVLQDKPVWDGMLDEVTITPYTQSEIAFQELMNNKATGGLEPVYPVFEVLSAGIKTPFTASAKALQTGVRKAPSVINPRYFKPNSNMYYRGIGKKGMEDALQSGLFRAKPADQIPARMVDLGSVGKVDMAKRFNNTYYSPQFSIADRYGAGYIAEVPKDIANFRKRYKGSDWSMATKDQIPISEGQILKKDWWSGYKPIKQNGGTLPTYQTKGETPLTRKEIFNVPRTMAYEDGKMVVQDKPIWDGMLDEVTITPYTQSQILWDERQMATGGLDPVYPVFDILSLGLKTPLQAGAKSIQAAVKKAPSKINPRYYNPTTLAKGDPDVFYRTVGKDAYEDFVKSGFVRTQAEVTDNPIIGLLETQKELRQVRDAIKDYGQFTYKHPTNFRAPYFSKGKMADMTSGGGDYLIQTRPGLVGGDAFISGQMNILHGAGNSRVATGGYGIMDPMKRSAENFDVFKKSWWHGYKPVKQLGGSLTKYQVQGEVFPTMLDEVTVIDKGAPSAFGKGSSDRMGTTYTIPMNIKNARGYSQNGMRVLFDSPGKLAKDAQKEFRSQFGFNANKLKKNFKNIFSQDFITLGDDQTFQNAAYAGPMSLSNSYFINESDNIIEPRTISRSNTKVTTNLINNDRSALLADMARPGTKADFFNLFQQREGFRPYLEAKVSNGKVYDAKLGEEDVTSRSPFESNMINYLGSDAYFERLAGTQYNNEIDVNKWSTDKDYRKSYAERLKADKPEFLKNYYEGLSKTLANPIVAEIDHNLGSYASAGTHNHGTLTGQNVIDYNPYNFNNAFGGAEKRKEALIKELERRGATPAEIDVTMEYGIGPGMNDNFSDVMSHELAHVYSLGSKDYILNNESANVAPGIDKEYELLWNINKDTKDQPFYSYQNHLNTGSKPISYNTALNSEIQNVADRLNTRYHNISPEETKADVYGIRNYLLRTQGQDYDQPFTKENYDSLMNDDKFKEGLFYKRMQERYGDDQSKWMKAMNLIASKEDGKNYRMYAERGGQLPKAQEGASVDPEMMFRNKYNTELTPEEKNKFDQWVVKESEAQGRDILMDLGAYDVQGFWKSGDYKRRDGDGHGTDTWKKPNHPTFSNQSKYHGVDGWYGGNWTKDGGYQPSKQTLETYGPEYYEWMFGLEPNRPEHLDMSRYESGTNSPTPVYYQKGGQPGSSDVSEGQYVVQKGDTFYGIANKQGVSWEDLLKANPDINADKISIGQSINLPSSIKPNYVYNNGKVVSVPDEVYENTPNYSKSSVFLEDALSNLTKPAETSKLSGTLDLNNVLNYLVADRGNTRDFWTNTADTIAYHESWHTMDPRMKQADDGPARGMFQFEGPAFETFKTRYKTVADVLGLDTDENILKATSADQLTPEQQYTAFLVNLIESNAVLKDYADGKTSIEDLWLTGHKNKEAKGDRKAFRTSADKAKVKGITGGYADIKKQGGENIPVYNTYKTKNRAWLAARKNLGPNKKFMFGGKVYSTSTPKGL